MRVLIILTVLLTSITISFSDELDTRIKTEAQKSADALIAQDWDTVVKYTYPMVVESIGGREKMIQILQNGTIQMASQGISIQKVVIDDPLEKRRIQKTIYALVPQNITIKVSGGLLHQKSYLIGISHDEGENWYFLDTSQLNGEKLKMIFPDLDGQMTIPQREQPVFEEN